MNSKNSKICSRGAFAAFTWPAYNATRVGQYIMVAELILMTGWLLISILKKYARSDQA
jgi:heme exporter protein D